MVRQEPDEPIRLLYLLLRPRISLDT
jgi:hypothetical protein